jgi:hypothetical protein
MYACGVVAVLGMLAPGAHAANLIKNGSFEKPVVSAGSYELFGQGTKFGGWTVVGAAGNVAVVSNTFVQDGFTFPAAGGVQWVDLTGNSNTPTGIQQTVATAAGTAYTLSFYVGNVNDPGGIFGVASTVNVYVNGTFVFTATNSRGAGQTKMVWQKFSTTITANTASTTIAFINGDPSNDTANGIDLVSLVAEPDSEPLAEPDSE